MDIISDAEKDGVGRESIVKDKDMVKERYVIYDRSSHSLLASRENITLEEIQKEYEIFLTWLPLPPKERYVIAKLSYEVPEKEVVKWGVYNKTPPSLLLFNVFGSKEEAEELAIGYPNLQVISFTVKE